MSLQKLFLQEVKQELDKQQLMSPILDPEDFSALPRLLQKHLENAGYVGKPLPQNMYLVWGETNLKLNPQKDWMQIDCVQFNAAHGPMRNALMSSKMFGLIPFAGKDKYQNGKGNMYVKLSMFTVSDARGPEMDTSALVTFLSESILLPAALLSPYISWQQLDRSILLATITHAGKTAAGKFYFDENGLPEKFETEDRFYSTDGIEHQQFPWVAYYLGYKRLNDYLIPTELKASWKLPDGEYTYFTGKIKSVKYDIEDVTQLKV